MPIYEYQCDACEKTFEDWTKHAEEADVTHPCPDCNAQCKRVMSQTTFVLAGGGWYATDYGNRKSSAGQEKKEKIQDRETSASSASGSGGSSDSGGKSAAAPGSGTSSS